MMKRTISSFHCWALRPKYAVYTKRILPLDTGAINSLPKARIFHVPDETGRKLMEQQLVENLVIERITADSSSSEIADTLEKLADQIDKETNRLSGGLLLIGGAIACVNPVLGVGIALNGLLPSIGAKASKAGAEYVGSKLRNWNRSSSEAKLRKSASGEVKKLRPIIFQNPILRSLDVIVTNPNTDFDPAFDRKNWIDQFSSFHHYAATSEAIHEVYQGVLEAMDLSEYQTAHIQWIKSFRRDPES